MNDQTPVGSAESKTILVVDDDPKIARLIRSYLEQAGYKVEHANNGEAALQAVRTLRPALMILDLGLPIKDGLEVTRTIRSDARRGPFCLNTHVVAFRST